MKPVYATLPSTPRSSIWFFLAALPPTKPCRRLTFTPYVLHARPTQILEDRGWHNVDWINVSRRECWRADTYIHNGMDMQHKSTRQPRTKVCYTAIYTFTKLERSTVRSQLLLKTIIMHTMPHGSVKTPAVHPTSLLSCTSPQQITQLCHL